MRATERWTCIPDQEVNECIGDFVLTVIHHEIRKQLLE
jgi:hypothetical protein